MNKVSDSSKVKTALSMRLPSDVSKRLFAAVALLALTLLCLTVIGQEGARSVVRHGGYAFTFAAALGFVAYLFRALSEGDWRCCFRWASRPSLRREWLSGLSAVLVGSWLLFAHADFGPKIAMDDYLLSATAKHMHESREVGMVTFGRSIQGSFHPVTVTVDKRPWLYPFLVSGLHDLTGYRCGNPFLANGLLAVAFLAGAYGFGRLVAGRAAGWLAVLLWVSLPLLAQNATGSGMELTNLFMLQLVVLLAALYVWRPGHSTEGALCFAAVLLAYARYESMLFLLPVLCCIVVGWLRRREVLLSWGAVFSAPLLAGVLLQTKLYAATESAWEAAQGTESPIALSHLIGNIPHALGFFFSLDHQLANSLLLSFAGFGGALAFCFLLRTELRVYRERNPMALAFTIFAPFLLLSLLVAMAFHAGRLDSPFVSRYALPVHLLFVGAVLCLLGYAADRVARVWPASLAMVGLFVLCFTLPMNSKAVFSKTNFMIREQAWLEALGGTEMEAPALVIDRFSMGWSLREWSSLEPGVALPNAARIAGEIAKGKYEEAWLVERLRLQDGQFVSQQPEVAKILEIFRTEVVAERGFRPFELTRLYRLTAYVPKENDSE